MLEEKILSIALSLFLLLQAWLLGIRAGSWASPTAIFSFFLFLYSFIPLVALPSVPANPLAILYFLLAGFAFGLATFVLPSDWFGRSVPARESSVNFDTPFLVNAFWAFSAVTITSTVINWSIQGLTFEGIFFDLLNTTATYLDNKYGGRLVPNHFATIAIILVYPMVALGGLIFASRRAGKSRSSIFLAAFLPALMFIVVEGNKGTLPGVIVIFLASVLVVRLSNGEKSLIKASQLRSLVLAMLFLIPVLLVAFMARGLSGIEDAELLFSLLRNMFASYFFGHLYAFSDWFSFYIGDKSEFAYSSSSMLGGFYTFMPVYQIFSQGPAIPSGIYSEYYSYEVGRIAFETNIYTMFRGLIIDFGLLGGLIVLALLGCIASGAFSRLCGVRQAPISAAIFIHAIWFGYASFGVSLFTWDSSFLSFALLSCLLLVNARTARGISRAVGR